MTIRLSVRYNSFMSSRPASPLKIEPRPLAAADRLAMLMDLPLRADPETDEERAIFDDAQAALSQGVRGLSTNEVLSAIDASRNDAAAR